MVIYRILSLIFVSKMRVLFHVQCIVPHFLYFFVCFFIVLHSICLVFFFVFQFLIFLVFSFFFLFHVSSSCFLLLSSFLSRSSRRQNQKTSSKCSFLPQKMTVSFCESSIFGSRWTGGFGKAHLRVTPSASFSFFFSFFASS